jgi:hypothetical protein
MGHADNFNMAARERWVDQRADAIADNIINAGSMTVAPFWAASDANGRQVPVVADFIGWLQQERRGDADVAVCINGCSTRRVRLFCDYAEARTIAELDALPSDYFSEVA